jgi:hypothetical protein
MSRQLSLSYLYNIDTLSTIYYTYQPIFELSIIF